MAISHTGLNIAAKISAVPTTTPTPDSARVASFQVSSGLHPDSTHASDSITYTFSELDPSISPASLCPVTVRVTVYGKGRESA